MTGSSRTHGKRGVSAPDDPPTTAWGCLPHSRWPDAWGCLQEGGPITNSALFVNKWIEGNGSYTLGIHRMQLSEAPFPVSSKCLEAAGLFLHFLPGIWHDSGADADPLWIKGQNQEGCWLLSPLCLLPSPNSINHFWQVAGKQLRMTVLLWSTRSHLLTRLLLFVS